MRLAAALCLLSLVSAGILPAEEQLASSRSIGSGYKVKTVRVGANRERQVFLNGQYFMTVVQDHSKAVAIRPHPGVDPNGWGASWYPETFLPGATLQKCKISVRATSYGVILKSSGYIYGKANIKFGKWSTFLILKFDSQAKKITGSGTQNIQTKNWPSTVIQIGDLNICKIASNYLANVPLVGGTTGDTGDMKQVDVTCDFGSFTWIPKDNPSYFPQDQTANMTINVLGNYNNVDSAAMGDSAIAQAAKPNMKVTYKLNSAYSPGSIYVAPRSVAASRGLIPITVMQDDFNTGTTVNSSLWHIPTWVSSTDGTYLGRTQFRCTQNYGLPSISNGSAQLLLETYNPTSNPANPSFLGTDLISDQAFSLGQGVIITFVAKMNTPCPRGMVGAGFSYNLINAQTGDHDEDDVEFISNNPTQVQTNYYANRPLDAGDPAFYTFPSGSITDWHTYQIQWLPDRLTWYVDGNLVRIITSAIPAGPMYLHLNIWAPASNWIAAYDAGLQPVTSAASNQIYSMSVDSVKVESLQAAVLSSITVSPASASLQVGQTQQLTPQTFDQAGNPFSTTVTWTSNNTAVATVDQAGLVSAVSAGTAKITASNGSIVSPASTITVTSPPPTPVLSSITVSPQSAYVQVGQTKKLTAQGFDQSGTKLDATFTWASNNTAVATVDQTGLVSAIATGTADITASSGSVKSPASAITVNTSSPPPATLSSITVSPQSATMQTGKTLQLKAETFDQGGNPFTATVTWASDNTAVATVDQTGLVSAVSAGTAKITASNGSVSSSPATITVTGSSNPNPTPSPIPMIFGGMYDQSSSTQFWADNVGITPLILSSSKYRWFLFNVEFESTAIPEDH